MAARPIGCTLIFDSKYKPQLEKVIAEVIVEEWGEKGLARAKAGGIRNPILAGDGKEARSKQTGELHPGFGPGLIFIRTQANEDRPPQVRYRDGKEMPATPEEVYRGCYGFAVLNAFAWNHPQSGDGVSFGIRYFQKTRDGESIGGITPLDVDAWHEQVDEDPDFQNEPRPAAGRRAACSAETALSRAAAQQGYGSAWHWATLTQRRQAIAQHGEARRRDGTARCCAAAKQRSPMMPRRSDLAFG